LAVCSGQWGSGSRQWAVGSLQFAVGSLQWAAGYRHSHAEYLTGANPEKTDYDMKKIMLIISDLQSCHYKLVSAPHHKGRDLIGGLLCADLAREVPKQVIGMTFY